MIVIASKNGKIGIKAAIDVLRSGGSALDAVETGTRMVEAYEGDHSVGVGGYPNILGEVELDASIMEGTTRKAGAVAALREYPNPISVARMVMEKLPQHLLLVGSGAAHFAEEYGFQRMELLTPDVEKAWQKRVHELTRDCPEHLPIMGEGAPLSTLTQDALDPEKAAGTVNFIAVDSEGHIASAVSTSGWAYKYPGRTGDSSIIGAGNYCDDRYGACTCTGIGEWAIRAGTARSVVSGLEFGLSLEAACKRAMEDLKTIPTPQRTKAVMHFIALDIDGRHTGYSTESGNKYIWQTPEMDGFVVEARKTI